MEKKRKRKILKQLEQINASLNKIIDNQTLIFIQMRRMDARLAKQEKHQEE